MGDSNPEPKEKVAKISLGIDCEYHPLGKAKKFGIGLGVFIMIILVIGGLSNKPSPLTETEIKSRAIADFSYDDLKNNNESFVGKIIYDFGIILQIEKTGEKKYSTLIALSKDGTEFSEFIWLNSSAMALSEGDPLEFWAEVKGLRHHKDNLGNSTLIPEVIMLKGTSTKMSLSNIDF